MEGDDVGMAEGLEDLDLAVEVLLELLVQAGELDRLDRDGRLFDLQQPRVSKACTEHYTSPSGSCTRYLVYNVAMSLTNKTDRRALPTLCHPI
jgi:hypothetical protein